MPTMSSVKTSIIHLGTGQQAEKVTKGKCSFIPPGANSQIWEDNFQYSVIMDSERITEDTVVLRRELSTTVSSGKILLWWDEAGSGSKGFPEENTFKLQLRTSATQSRGY